MTLKRILKKEIEVYGNNSDDYSYVYYIMKKRSLSIISISIFSSTICANLFNE